MTDLAKTFFKELKCYEKGKIDGLIKSPSKERKQLVFKEVL